MKSVFFVLKENLTNLHRILAIAKFELISEMRESKLGIFWNFANPLIQIFTFWLVFGIGLRGGRPVTGGTPPIGVSFLPWMIVGMTVWFFISPCITKSVNCIYEKRNIITKMKFPVSILPATVVLKEWLNHIVTLCIVCGLLIIRGHQPTWMWLQVFYYMICAIAFTISLGLVTSVLNMFTRDIKKLVGSCMRMLMYLTPILWTMERLDGKYEWLQIVLKMNPLYYIVEGYRGSLFFNDSFLQHPAQTYFFWGVVLSLFCIGSILMYRFKHKFIDMI